MAPGPTLKLTSVSVSSLNTMLPPSMKPLLSSIPAKVLVSTLLPQPDSPTMAMDSFS